MKLYLIDGTYCGTQAEAKAEAKRVGIKFDATTHEANVPTDKEGLIAYLNGLSRGVYGATPLTVPTLPELLGDIAPMHHPIEMLPVHSLASDPRETPMAERVAHNINVEEEIGRADYPTAVRLTLHATSRLQEHLEGRA